MATKSIDEQIITRRNENIRGDGGMPHKHIDKGIKQPLGIGKVSARSKTVPRMHAKKHR